MNKYVLTKCLLNKQYVYFACLFIMFNQFNIKYIFEILKIN